MKYSIVTGNRSHSTQRQRGTVYCNREIKPQCRKYYVCHLAVGWHVYLCTCVPVMLTMTMAMTRSDINENILNMKL